MLNLWTKEEEELLKEIYVNTPKAEILKRIDRSWGTIRQKALRLKIKRNPEIIKQDNITGTKKAMLEKYGVEYSTLLPSMQQKTRETNLRKRGVAYPTQSKEVRDKVKKTVQEKYGVDYAGQIEEGKIKAKETNLRKYGVENPQQNIGVQNKTKVTNLKKYGIENTFQLVDRVQAGMIKNHGVSCPLKNPEIMKKKEETCLEKYGYTVAAKNPEVRKKLSETLSTPEVKEKKHLAFKAKKNFNISNEESNFLGYLFLIDPEIKTHILHPIIRHNIDFYSPKYNLYIQYDGEYWHGKYIDKLQKGKQIKNILRNMENDKFENENIPNLIRFWSDEVTEAIKNNTITNFIENKIKEKLKVDKELITCSQYQKKLEYYTEDLKKIPFNPDNIKASSFLLAKEELSTEIIEFIERYEWLGTIGVHPKWCFTARYKEILGGVVLINEPIAYSTILGNNTAKYEALIQRGASASWTPKNLGSKLIMFSCNWMKNNTDKRAFVGYADPSAKERGIIYQACNFDYLGNNFGNSYIYQHPNFDNTFTSQTLKRTSAFRKWCLDNNIEVQKEWFKKNKFKDLNEIPFEIKNNWYDYIKRIINQSEKIAVTKKMKYVLVLYRNKNEKKLLEKLKTYKALPYNKLFNPASAFKPETNYKNNHGITASRKNSEKIKFIIENNSNMSRAQLAKELNESERWVKRQIRNLKKEGKLVGKR